MTTDKPLTARDFRFDPPRFEQATLAAVAAEHYGLTGDLVPLDGERDQNHRLTTSDGTRYVLKVSGETEDPEVVDFQVKALQHLQTTVPDLNVPRIHPTLAGAPQAELVSATGARHAVRLLTWVDGAPFSAGGPPGRQALLAIGTFQGRLCRGFMGLDHPASGHFVAWNISEAVILNPGVQAVVGMDVRDLVAPFLDHVATNVLPALEDIRHQVIHNDCHEGNVLVNDSKGGGVAGLIDFGDIVRAPLVQDLAVSMASFSRMVPDPHADTLALLQGFHAQFPLEEAELALLFDLIRMRVTTALMLYDFRIHLTEDPPEFLTRERPEIVKAYRRLDDLDPGTVTDSYRQLCGFESTFRNI